MKTLLSSLFFLFFVTAANAQTKTALCGADDVYREQLRTDPAFRQTMLESKKKWQAYLADKHNTAQKMVVEGNDTIYEIPVVVHVINPGTAVGTAYNRSDADVIAWIDYVNKVYSATWAAYPDTATGGVKVPIRFVLARRSPACSVTNGINRVDGSVLTNYVANGLNRANTNGVTEAQIRGIARWNPASYYNIYVVNKIDGADGYNTVGTYIAGYAYFAGSSATVDGAFMLSYVVDPTDQTLPHELGHAMGLYHTFEGVTAAYPACGPAETDCTTQGDLICDTEYSPNNLGVNPCPTNANTNPCTLLPYNNVQYNFMNYGSCRNRFTAGQKSRMVQQMLAYRSALINSLALDTPLPAPVVLAPACTVPVNVITNAATNIGPCNVSLNTINYTSHGYNLDGNMAYINHALSYCSDPNAGTTLTVGTPYSFTVTTESNVQRLKAYLDYNNDGIFDSTANEEIMFVDNAAVGSHMVTLTPPLTATLGTTLRLRIMSDTRLASNGAFNYSACDSMRSGQVEDFYVKLISNIPTPIAYVNQLYASPDACHVQLNWTIGNKDAAVQFLSIERSNDGASFSKLADLDSKNTNTNFTDTKPLNGTNFYRLKWLNADAGTQYSSIANATVHCSSVVKIYPNPFTSQCSIELTTNENQVAAIEVYDLSGKKVWSNIKNLLKGFSRTTIDLSSLADAVYILKINGATVNEQMMMVKGGR